jgi:hypothetical protein
MMIFRALVMVLFLGGLALADMSADPALAQETKAGRPAGGQTPAVPPTFDPIAARIKYLHDRLRITPDQEPLWDTVAQVIRNNAQDTTPLLRERLRAKTSGSALDVLHSYEALGEAQLDGLNKFRVFAESSGRVLALMLEKAVHCPGTLHYGWAWNLASKMDGTSSEAKPTALGYVFVFWISTGTNSARDFR